MTNHTIGADSRAIAIQLPWPHKDLNPNQRVHWAQKARAVKSARAAAWWAAKAAGADRLKAEALDVALEFMPPDARRRDLDGMLSSLKSALDGISDATGIDDSKFNLTIRRGEVIRGGLVKIELKRAA